MIARDYFHPGWRRVEIPKEVLVAVWGRVLRAAGGDPLRVACEGCGLILGKKKAQYDHTLAEAFQRLPPHERPPITPKDVKRLGLDCCHKFKSGVEVSAISKTKRLAEKEAQAKTKTSSWKKRHKEKNNTEIRIRTSPLYRSVK